MKLHLIRHAESENNILKRYNKHHTALTARGLRQAISIANSFKKKDIEAIFSSDALRCKQTAKKLSAKLLCPVNYSSLLRPINKGVLSGKPKSLFYQYLAKSHKGPLNFKASRGESFQEVYTRAKLFIQLMKKKNYKEIIVLSHSTFIQTLKLALRHQPLNKRVLKEIPNCHKQTIILSS